VTEAFGPVECSEIEGAGDATDDAV
jgi:hypothetical protein